MKTESDHQSIKDIYKMISTKNSGSLKFSIYFSLVRVGLVIMAAASMLFIVSMLLFAPTFSLIPYGRSGQVLLGVVGSIFSIRIYNLYKISSRTLLIAGQDILGGGGKIWRYTSSSAAKRFAFCILFFQIGLLVIYSTLYIFDRWSRATSYTAEGFFANLGPELDFLLFISVLMLLLGGILTFSGFILAAWILSSVFRSFFIISYWRVKNMAIVLISDTMNKYTGIEFGVESDMICPMCYNTSFVLCDNKSSYDVDYELYCSQCSNQIEEVHASIKNRTEENQVSAN